GPDRWMSTYHLLGAMTEKLKDFPSEKRNETVARLITRLWTMHQMSCSIAGMLENGMVPSTEAALAKDLGTTFEQDIPEAANRLFPEEIRQSFGDDDLFNDALRYTTLYAPAYSIRGGTKEILRGIIAKGL